MVAYTKPQHRRKEESEMWNFATAQKCASAISWHRKPFRVTSVRLSSVEY